MLAPTLPPSCQASGSSTVLLHNMWLLCSKHLSQELAVRFVDCPSSSCQGLNPHQQQQREASNEVRLALLLS